MFAPLVLVDCHCSTLCGHVCARSLAIVLHQRTIQIVIVLCDGRVYTRSLTIVLHQRTIQIRGASDPLIRILLDRDPFFVRFLDIIRPNLAGSGSRFNKNELN